jgi:hypothetical protein
MAADLRERIGRTSGSYVVLGESYGIRPRTRLSGYLRNYHVPARKRSLARSRSEPVQTPGSSSFSRQLKDYLRQVLAENSALVSEAPKQISLTSSSSTRAATMDPWAAKNRRRIRLIEKKHKGVLNARESDELAKLDAQITAHVQQVAPRSREVLNDFADYVSKLKAKVAAKKEAKP